MDAMEDPRAHPALYRISTLAGRVDEPREALESVLGILIETFVAASGSVALVNPDTGRLEIELQHGLPAESDHVALRLGQGITGWVAFHGRPQLVPDVASDHRYIRLRPTARAEMAAPMLREDGQVLGVINLDSDQVGGFAGHDLELFVLLTREVTAVMQRLWQLRHLQGKARQLETLIAIGQDLVTKLDPQELFDSITGDARTIMQGSACALYLHESVAGSVRVVSLNGTDVAALPPFREVPLDSSLVAVAVRTRKSVEFSNIQSPEFGDLSDVPRDPSLQSVLLTPLLSEDQVMGALALFTDRVHRFNNDEKRLVAALASLAAVAVQNTRLYARVFQSEASLRKNEQLTTLGLLAAEIAHEIRNPLTVIKLLYGHLGLDFAEGDPRRTDVRLIREKLDQLEAIVTRVLSFAKAPSNLHSRWNISEVIEETILLIRLKLAQSKIHLHFSPPEGPLIVEAHKGQLQQVLLNLLLNSTQAMPGGGEISIVLGTTERAGAPHAIIDLTDSGSGIPDGLQGQIFDSFLSGGPDGTGLGLAIAKRILLGHRGDIQLVSSGPSGTTMRIFLPLVRS